MPSRDGAVGHVSCIPCNVIGRHCRRGLTEGLRLFTVRLLCSLRTIFLRRTHREIRAHRHNPPTHEGVGRVRACCRDEVVRRLPERIASESDGELSVACSERGPDVSGRGKRVNAHPPSSVRRGPDSDRIRAFFIVRPQPACASAQSSDRGIAPPAPSGKGDAL